MEQAVKDLIEMLKGEIQDPTEKGSFYTLAPSFGRDARPENNMISRLPRSGGVSGEFIKINSYFLDDIASRSVFCDTFLRLFDPFFMGIRPVNVRSLSAEFFEGIVISRI